MTAHAPRYTLARYHDDTWADEIRKREGQTAARDPWCIPALLRMGEITPGQHGAAVRISSKMERAANAAAAGAERVDRSGADPHARMFDVAICAREAENALAYVRTNLVASFGSGGAIRICALDAAVSFPHRSISAAQRDAGMGYGGKARGLFVACLVDGLDLLQTHWDAVDAAVERERRRG